MWACGAGATAASPATGTEGPDGGTTAAPPIENPIPSVPVEAISSTPVADLRTAGASAFAGRSRRELLAALSGQQSRVRYCYETARREGENPEGSVSVRLSIGKAGDVQAAEVVENLTSSDSFARCLLTISRRIAFPADEGPLVIIYEYSMSGGGL
jgi:outer membrane biosynthesis protein TonB